MLYNKIIAKLPGKWVFASTVAPLTAFYALFATVLYPMSAVLHPQQMAAMVRTLHTRLLCCTGATGLHAAPHDAYAAIFNEHLASSICLNGQ